MLMQTYVYAYTGSGTKNDPYTVTTYNELKKCCEEGGYVKLGSNIIYSGSSSIGSSATELAELAQNRGRWISGTRFGANVKSTDVAQWIAVVEGEI